MNSLREVFAEADVLAARNERLTAAVANANGNASRYARQARQAVQRADQIQADLDAARAQLVVARRALDLCARLLLAGAPPACGVDGRYWRDGCTGCARAREVDAARTALVADARLRQAAPPR